MISTEIKTATTTPIETRSPVPPEPWERLQAEHINLSHPNLAGYLTTYRQVSSFKERAGGQKPGEISAPVETIQNHIHHRFLGDLKVSTFSELNQLINRTGEYTSSRMPVLFNGLIFTHQSGRFEILAFRGKSPEDKPNEFLTIVAEPIEPKVTQTPQELRRSQITRLDAYLRLVFEDRVSATNTLYINEHGVSGNLVNMLNKNFDCTPQKGMEDCKSILQLHLFSHIPQELSTTLNSQLKNGHGEVGFYHDTTTNLSWIATPIYENGKLAKYKLDWFQRTYPAK